MSKTAPLEIDSERLKTIGRIIRKARENLRYSYRELSSLSGVSASQLLRMESGEFEFSVTKFLNVSEALGLSAGVVLETAMFRRLPRGHSYWAKPLKEFLRKKGLTDEDYENRILMLGSFVDGLAEMAASLVLSSNPEVMCFYFNHPFRPMVEAIENFAHRRVIFGASHHERAAALKALFEDPHGKLTQWQILDEKLMDDFLAWAQPKLEFSTAVDTHCVYAGILFGKATSWLNTIEPVDPVPLAASGAKKRLEAKRKGRKLGASKK